MSKPAKTEEARCATCGKPLEIGDGEHYCFACEPPQPEARSSRSPLWKAREDYEKDIAEIAALRAALAAARKALREIANPHSACKANELRGKAAVALEGKP